ncbi:MAG: hypothetical protein JSR34_03220 [Proteobacteria bacterium]|nr:hypothetical protein [Pseudomonadota bacterium]
MNFLIAFTFLIAAAPIAASPDNDVDPLCEPLRAFVVSVKPNETKELEFNTSWGSNFKGETKQAMFAARCTYNGYAPAHAVCTYLLNHGSIEFARYNVTRSISCLSPRTVFAPGIKFKQGDFSITYGTPDRGSFVDVKFHEDAQLGGMALMISVHGY